MQSRWIWKINKRTCRGRSDIIIIIITIIQYHSSFRRLHKTLPSVNSNLFLTIGHNFSVRTIAIIGVVFLRFLFFFFISCYYQRMNVFVFCTNVRTTWPIRKTKSKIVVRDTFYDHKLLRTVRSRLYTQFEG